MATEILIPLAERETLLKLIQRKLERIPTELLRAWLPVIDEYAEGVYEDAGPTLRLVEVSETK